MSGQEGRYKSKTSLLKIELELKKIDWAPRKINLKKQRSNSLMLKFPILERILFKGMSKQQNSISCVVVGILYSLNLKLQFAPEK